MRTVALAARGLYAGIIDEHAPVASVRHLGQQHDIGLAGGLAGPHQCAHLQIGGAVEVDQFIAQAIAAHHFAYRLPHPPFHKAHRHLALPGHLQRTQRAFQQGDVNAPFVDRLLAQKRACRTDPGGLVSRIDVGHQCFQLGQVDLAPLVAGGDRIERGLRQQRRWTETHLAEHEAAADVGQPALPRRRSRRLHRVHHRALRLQRLALLVVAVNALCGVLPRGATTVLCMCKPGQQRAADQEHPSVHGVFSVVHQLGAPRLTAPPRAGATTSRAFASSPSAGARAGTAISGDRRLSMRPM